MGYKVAVGHNVALVSLAEIVPNPRTSGLQATERSYSANGGVYDSARFVEFEWNIIGSVTAYQALLTQFGVNSALFADVTIYARYSQLAWVRLNGIAVRPESQRDMKLELSFPRNVVLLVKDIEVAA